MARRRLWRIAGLCGALMALGGPAPAGDGGSAAPQAGEPLRERVDRAIEAGLGGNVAAPATDGEFLRRVCLDLQGMIPTADEARAFLDDPSPYKRQKLVDRLLDSPEYARRMATFFDVALMERRPDTHVPAAEWRAYLRDAFARDVPFHELAREILAADGSDPARRAPAKFYLDRESDPYALTRDVGRLFLGRDMQCAQCHDHVLVDDYKQAHYYGLYAFFSRSYAVQDASGRTVLGEKAEGDVTFESVFKKGTKHATGPKLLDGPEVAESAPPKGDEYVVYPGDKAKAIPRVSRRARLAPLLTSGEVAAFNRTIANRLWALMMGRGLIQPLDFDHSDNPPSHPELLDLLAREFAAGGFRIKPFLRELALTRTYARSSEPPPDLSASDAAPEKFAVAALRPMSPEQIGWSVMQATGIVTSYRAAATHKLTVVDPKLKAIFEADPRRREMRRWAIEQEVYDQLAGSVGPFIAQFGRPPGQSQDGNDSTVHQALFLANGDPLQSWIGNLTGRLNGLADPSALAEELYLSVLTRRPTPEERADVTAYLAERAQDRPGAIRELAWALLNATEFRFNH